MHLITEELQVFWLIMQCVAVIPAIPRMTIHFHQGILHNGHNRPQQWKALGFTREGYIWYWIMHLSPVCTDQIAGYKTNIFQITTILGSEEAEIFTGQRGPLISHSRCQSWWQPGDRARQSIKSNVICLVLLVYGSCSTTIQLVLFQTSAIIY